jgi:hypothetical protein
MNSVGPQRIPEIVWADVVRQKVTLYRTSDNRPVCPVCGRLWAVGGEHAWHDTPQRTAEGLVVVMPSWAICIECGTEFGSDDAPAEGETLEDAWAQLRQRWLERVGRNPTALRQLSENLGLGPME